jgi:hypothetical protein
MKKILFGFFVLSILFTTSCKKSPSPNPGGSWTFKSTTYNTNTCTGNGSVLTASTLTSSNTTTYGTLSVSFQTALPTTNGTYTVNSYPNSASQVAVNLTTNGGTGIYSSTGGNGAETVSVTVSNGKVSISGSGIIMVTDPATSDSSAVTFNITQLQ